MRTMQPQELLMPATDTTAMKIQKATATIAML
jgi:hypothetical protein